MEDVVQGFFMVVSPMSLGVLFVGLLLGFVAGALPGFDSVNAAAIVLGFTIHLSVQDALIAMAGIYAGTSYAGAIPAILINVPGTAGAAATSLDGYPMARRGEAARAISIARSSSMIGGVIGSVAVLVAIGPMAKAALNFTSPELTLVGVIAMMVIGSVVGDSIPKGMLALFAGMLLATMSASAETGMPRYNMGFLELYESFPFVPVALGVFALSQMFIFAGESTGLLAAEKAAKQGQPAAGGGKTILQAWREAAAGMTEPFRSLGVAVRSSVVGLAIGILPGTGTTITNFVAYGLAKKRSKHPEEFGKGAPDGIIASESADNACVVGTLVPTFTLGIPGSATAAVIMGAAMMQGWTPGPNIMRDHAVEIYAVVWGLLIAAIAIAPTAVVLAGPLSRIATLRPLYLIPPVILLCLVGAFAVRNSLFDVGLALLFGVIGVIMRKTGYPVVPLVLGLILAPIIESNLVRSLQLSHYSPAIFFEGKLTLALWGVLLLVVAGNFWSFIKRGRARKHGTMEAIR